MREREETFFNSMELFLKFFPMLIPANTWPPLLHVPCLFSTAY